MKEHNCCKENKENKEHECCNNKGKSGKKYHSCCCNKEVM